MLAKVVNDNAGNQVPRVALRFFASKLAPTENKDSGLERALLVSLGQLGAIVRMLPGLRFFFLAALPGALLLQLITLLVFVAHTHLPSIRIGHNGEA